MKLSRNFSREEFACSCGCGFDTADHETLMVLEHVRLKFGKPVTITSGCRCEAHNEAIGGAKQSYHLQGRAADFVVQGVDPAEVYKWLDESYPYRFGLGKYDTFTHIDTRSNGPARWG